MAVHACAQARCCPAGVALARSLLYGPPMDELKHMSVPSINNELKTNHKN